MDNHNEILGVPTPAIDEAWWEAVMAEETSAAQTGTPRVSPRHPTRSEPRAPHGQSANWEKATALFENDSIVELRVAGCNRGGLLVEGEDLGGFVPISHLIGLGGIGPTGERTSLVESYIGRTLRLKVIECAREDGRIVFSERAAQAEAGKRSEIFHTLRAGERVRGTVTNITDFGAFVDLGGVEGLIHISELSWGRVAHPKHILTLGATIDVEVIDLSPERSRVALSLKRLLPNPWTDIERELGGAKVLTAAITAILSYGAFARLDQGIEGLIHASEMPLANGQTVKELLHDGQVVQVRILHVDAPHQRMGLSMKLAEGE